MKSMSRFFSQAWRPALLVVSLGLIAYLLYFHHLNSLLPGYAPTEVSSYHAGQTWHEIVHNPVNAPYKLIVLALAVTGHHQLIITRIAAALCSVLAVIVFFLITRSWYGYRIGFFSTVLFATSAGLLHVARLGSPQILQMGILMLIGALLWHRRSPGLHPYLTYLVIIVFGTLLYVPGMVWFELVVALVVYKSALRHWLRSSLVQRISWSALIALFAAPLVFAIAQQPHLAASILGLPAHITVQTLSHIPRNLLDSLLSIGVRSNGTSLLWVGHSPLLNVMELILGALGAYYYVYQERSLRSLLLAGTSILGLLLASLGGNVTLACIIPLVYLLIAGGLNHFLGEWLAVFPRNPIARGTGLVIIGIMLFFSVFYQIRSYFIAWPHNTETRQTFRLPPS